MQWCLLRWVCNYSVTVDSIVGSMVVGLVLIIIIVRIAKLFKVECMQVWK